MRSLIPVFCIVAITAGQTSAQQLENFLIQVDPAANVQGGTNLNLKQLAALLGSSGSVKAPAKEILPAHSSLAGSIAAQNPPAGGASLAPLSRCVSAFTLRKGFVKSATADVPSRLRFKDVVTNVNGWDKPQQQFVAPCPGLYFFTFHAVSEKANDFTLALMKESKYQVTAYGSKDGYQWGANSAVLFLNKGERVWLEIQQGQVYEHPLNEAYTTFSGFIIHSFA